MLDFLVENDFLSTLIAFALVLIPAVIIHELGHFLAAKAVGITVLEFGIGFPPRVAKLFNWGETEFTLNWLPLGGFVRPLGEDMIRPLSEEETQRERERLLEQMEKAKDQDRELNGKKPVYLSEREELAARGVTDVRSVNEVKPLPRIFFMVAGALANFISAFVLFVLLGLMGVPQPVAARVQLGPISADSMLAEAGLQENDFIETVDGELFMTPRDFFRMLEAKAGEEVTLTVRRQDVIEPLTITLNPTAEEAQELANATGWLQISSVVGNSPAEAAGLAAGDFIIAFAGKDLTPEDDPFAELQRLSVENEGVQTTITVMREGEELTLNLTPRANPSPNSGRIGVGLVPQFYSEKTGITYFAGPDQEEYVPLSVGESLEYGVVRITTILRSIVELPARILRGESRAEEERVISVVGVSQLGGEFLQQSISENRPMAILDFIAVISIALGITNLLPIPALDGGRILFVLIEMVRGRPIPPEREGLIHLIGLAFLLSIGVIFILNDLINPVTELLR